MQRGLCEVIPEINGFPLAGYQENSKKEKLLVPKTQALLAFAYGINLLKKKDLNNPSFFNHIDQEMHAYENEDIDVDFTGIERIIQWLPFRPENIQGKINDLDERAQIARKASDFLRTLVSNIDKGPLFFAQ